MLLDNEGIAGIPRRLFAARSRLQAARGSPVTQRMVAEAVGVSEGMVGHWEKGRDNRIPDLPMIDRLARALDVSPVWLAYGVGPVERPPEVELPVAPDPALDRKVTPEERAAAKRLVDASTPRRRRGSG